MRKIVKHGNKMEWFIWKKKSIFQTTRRFKNKSYRKIINQQTEQRMFVLIKRNYW